MSNIYIDNPIEMENGGLFISNGQGRHPQRILGSFELIFVCHGELSIREGEQDYQLGQGDVLVLHPNVEHQGTANYPADLKFYWVHFYLNKFSKTARSSTFIDLVKRGLVVDISKMIELFNLLLREQELGVDKVTLNLMLLLIIREVSVKSDGERLSKPVELAYRAQSLIRRFYHQPLTPGVIAHQLNCNVDYLGRVYKQNFACSLGEAIQQHKVGAAKRTLMDINRTINELATELGFQDVGYFRRIFVKHVGMTPTAYRKLYAIHRDNAE